MRNLRIGYSPLSSDLNAAGDRRRIVFWAKARGHEIVTDLSSKVDLIVASEKSNFGSPFFEKCKAPILFDLVDAYLSPSGFLPDFARGLAKAVSGEISNGLKPFSSHIADFCKSAGGVVCSSVEQEILIQKYNQNTHVILDSHDEIPFLDAKKVRNPRTDSFGLLWEGQPATVRGVGEINLTLKELALKYSINLNFVTDEEYFLLLGKFLKAKTKDILRKELPDLIEEIELKPWSINNLVRTAIKSDFAIIPINLDVPMQRLKPENRLLIMWRLGLPCLTSASPAYIRTATQAGVDATCKDSKEWLAKLSRLMNDPNFAFTEIEKGQAFVSENHTSSILLSRWDRAVESVLG